MFVDMFFGYWVFLWWFVKLFLMQVWGFEIEMEFVVYVLELCMLVVEVLSCYKVCLEGLQSKLWMWSDGWQILMMILKFIKNGWLFVFFFVVCVVCVVFLVGLVFLLFKMYLLMGLVLWFLMVILSVVLVFLGSVFLVCGLVLDIVMMGWCEVKYLVYLVVLLVDVLVW